MIKINLLPSDSGGKAATGGPRGSMATPGAALFYGLIATVIVASCAYAWFAFSATQDAMKRLKAEERRRDDKRKQLVDKEKEFEEFVQRSSDIEEKFAVVQALNPENRLYWSEKINMIAKARLDLAVYVTKLSLTEKIEEKETQESIKRREEWKNRKNKAANETEPKAIKRPIINQSLLVEGIAYGTDSPSQLRQLVLFNEHLTSMTWTRQNGKTAHFIDNMESEFKPGSMKAVKVGGINVLRFGFTCVALPQTDNSNTSQTLLGATTTGGAAGPAGAGSKAAGKAGGGKSPADFQAAIGNKGSAGGAAAKPRASSRKEEGE
ncbi:MAG: hypothetical protein K1X53_01825 [Candidatus Sumerlaeaceae bacterium]|nr:hypothetical protein [Candidatus Sumerlaeaceae bacterium]